MDVKNLFGLLWSVIVLKMFLRQPAVETVPQTEGWPPRTTRFVYNDPVQTTPAICPHGTRCGFQTYDKDGEGYPVEFIKYCNCPDDMECRVDGEDISQQFFFYKCQNISDLPNTYVTEAMDKGSEIPEKTDTGIETVPGISDRVGSFADHNEL